LFYCVLFIQIERQKLLKARDVANLERKKKALALLVELDFDYVAWLKKGQHEYGYFNDVGGVCYLPKCDRGEYGDAPRRRLMMAEDFEALQQVPENERYKYCQTCFRAKMQYVHYQDFIIAKVKGYTSNALRKLRHLRRMNKI